MARDDPGASMQHTMTVTGGEDRDLAARLQQRFEELVRAQQRPQRPLRAPADPPAFEAAEASAGPAVDRPLVAPPDLEEQLGRMEERVTDLGGRLDRLCEQLDAVVGQLKLGAARIGRLPVPVTEEHLTAIADSIERKLAASITDVSAQVEQLGAQWREEIRMLEDGLVRQAPSSDVAPSPEGGEVAVTDLASGIDDVRQGLIFIARAVGGQQSELRELRAALDAITDQLPD
jgi:hypothetical protein